MSRLTVTPPSGSGSPPVTVNPDLVAADTTMTVTVLGTFDRQPPTIEVANVVADATESAGGHVSFIATATDNVDPNPVVSCDPASGSMFPIGDTQVTCNAIDASGNSSTATFWVHVKGASEQLADLSALVDSYKPDRKLGTSLKDKLALVTQAVAANQPLQACATLDAFVREVQAQTGKSFLDWQTAEMTKKVTQIKLVIGC
jgi:hypothetical protein